MFNEKTMEYSPKQGKEVPVWKSPKYEQSKKKAVEIIEKRDYIHEGDFWILMNETKSGKMAYTGLIISHNACLKINDAAEPKNKFKPSLVTVNTSGWNGALVFSYANDEQGIYEVGEVTPKNCKNEYPYAMAFKRLFDRVVLKISKLAFEGIYSDSEADEFKDPMDGAAPQKAKKPEVKFTCTSCRNELVTVNARDGSEWLPDAQAAYSKRKFGKILCPDCMKLAQKAESDGGRLTGGDLGNGAGV